MFKGVVHKMRRITIPDFDQGLAHQAIANLTCLLSACQSMAPALLPILALTPSTKKLNKKQTVLAVVATAPNAACVSLPPYRPSRAVCKVTVTFGAAAKQQQSAREMSRLWCRHYVYRAALLPFNSTEGMAICNMELQLVRSLAIQGYQKQMLSTI